MIGNTRTTLGGYLAGFAIAMAFVGFARADEPVLVFSTQDARIEFVQSDIRTTSVAILGADKAHLVFCLKKEIASKFDEFTRQHSSEPITITIAGKAITSNMPPNGLSNGCGVLGAFSEEQAKVFRRVLLGRKLPARNLTRKSESVAGYCPERDFIEVCLRSLTSVEAIRGWATNNGWKWRNRHASANTTSGTLFLNEHEQFAITEVRFSNIVVLECLIVPRPSAPDSAPPMCEESFPLLRSFVPNPGAAFSKSPPFTGRLHQWIYEEDKWRVLITATVDGDGRFPAFFVKKVGYSSGRQEQAQ